MPSDASSRPPTEVPHCLRRPWAAAEGRFASLVSTNAEGCAIGLIGLADDEGVRLNHGRPGAAGGPSSFRAALTRYGAAEPAVLTWPAVFDAGDIDPGATLTETHDRVTEAVEFLLALGLTPVGIGGGHDLTYPFVRAVAARHGPLNGVYLDAHLDVRAEEGSGMPFHRLIEGGHARVLHVHGLDPSANRRKHVAWFTSHGGRIGAEGDPVSWPEGDCFLSVDLDVLDQAFAPGVSASNPCGWTPAQVARWAHEAGRNPRVRCMDIMELCPPEDESGRTARLAAHLFLAFLRGFASRSAR